MEEKMKIKKDDLEIFSRINGILYLDPQKMDIDILMSFCKKGDWSDSTENEARIEVTDNQFDKTYIQFGSCLGMGCSWCYNFNQRRDKSKFFGGIKQNFIYDEDGCMIRCEPEDWYEFDEHISDRRIRVNINIMDLHLIAIEKDYENVCMQKLPKVYKFMCEKMGQ
jgi:hypothetical protein